MSELTVATLLRQQGQSQQAAEGLMRWLGQHPKDDQAWAALADCMLDLGDPAKAEVALRRAIEQVTLPAVLETLRITHRAAATWGVASPRIAVAGLNPHAGEGGLMGREEIEVIVPALQQARLQPCASSVYNLSILISRTCPTIRRSSNRSPYRASPFRSKL